MAPLIQFGDDPALIEFPADLIAKLRVASGPRRKVRHQGIRHDIHAFFMETILELS